MASLPVRLLLAPGPMKSSFSATAMARIVTRALEREWPFGGAFPVEITRLPLGDGGDGTASALARLRHGTPFRLLVSDAMGVRTRSHAYALGPPPGACPPFGPDANITRPNPTAALDLAGVCGLGRLRHLGRSPDPLRASTTGLGEALRAIADRIPEGPIWLGLGGSASTDGGVGFLTALGARALDRRGKPVPPGGEGLLHLARLDLERIPRVFADRLLALVDVASPLLGPTGSAALFGPQKGASPSEVHLLEEALTHLAEVAERDLGAPVTLRTTPGAGAAGGTGYGITLLAGSPDILVPGAETVLDLARFDDRLKDTDLVLTSEGALDATTLGGKLPAIILEKAVRVGRPCVLVCARSEQGAARYVEAHGGTVATALTHGERKRAGADDLGRAAVEGLRAVGFGA